ncbi:pre-miRNA 5'-monophosphate methyltransferase isoform X2 [Mastacembelus armatus]|uniref:pre-miRNA 5'-monophosphate methyltransferase isoform X2 n=1 Tax=Mastacembelus armatus TaxID=205130 RepID=UPI000E4581B0|nr:RNA 5'-monophosphate methyltransferase isoform X2 [Mastacembelus armatus]
MLKCTCFYWVKLQALSTFNTTTEVILLSKAPNPQLLPGRRSNGCPLPRELSVALYKHLIQETVCEQQSNGSRVHLLGFDLDEALIQRAQQNNPLPSRISFIPLDITSDTDALQDHLIQHGCSHFHLCLCLAVTMWVHLNHGDSGLLHLLSCLASISEHLLLEAQPWKCYRSAARRLRKLGRSDFDHFKTLKIRGDIAEHAREHLERHCGMKLIQSFGSTAWDRKLLLFKRRLD